MKVLSTCALVALSVLPMLTNADAANAAEAAAKPDPVLQQVVAGEWRSAEATARDKYRHPAESLDATHPDQDDQPLHQVEDKKGMSPPDKLLHGELEDKIQEALNSLPENQRTAILLCRQDDLSYEDIAEILGCSLSATKSLIHRGRETLKERLKPYLRTGAWETQQ